MTAIVRLTRAELRKLATTPAFIITLATAVALAVISVVANAANAGHNGAAPLGTDAATYQMLKLGPVIFVAMLVLGIIASGGEYRYRTIISAMLIAPRRGTQIAAKAIAVATAGVVLSGLTFGLGLAAAVGELHARGIDQLPAGTAGMFAGSVTAAVLFGLIGVAWATSPAAPSPPSSALSAGWYSPSTQSCTPSPPGFSIGWSAGPPPCSPARLCPPASPQPP